MRCVHGNPVRAGSVGRPEEYVWEYLREYRSGRWEAVSEAEACQLLGQPELSALAGL